MAKKIVVLSGRVSSGKTTLSGLLCEMFGGESLKSKDVIQRRAREQLGDRAAFQQFGDYLDRTTNHAWVCKELLAKARESPEAAVIVVDAVSVRLQHI